MTKKECGLCGTKFTNVFDAVDHTRKAGSEEGFNPKIILAENARLGLGLLLNKIFLRTDRKDVHEAVQETYSLLYIAQMRPKAFPVIYDAFLKSLEAGDETFDITKFVYMIVTQEAYKEVGLR